MRQLILEYKKSIRIMRKTYEATDQENVTAKLKSTDSAK